LVQGSARLFLVQGSARLFLVQDSARLYEIINHQFSMLNKQFSIKMQLP
jgi:hypothetical protein